MTLLAIIFGIAFLGFSYLAVHFWMQYHHMVQFLPSHSVVNGFVSLERAPVRFQSMIFLAVIMLALAIFFYLNRRKG